MPEMILLETEERMEKAIDSYKRELNTIRTGRANPHLLDSISVEYYGVVTPMNQVANISVPESNQLYIKPYDKALLRAMEVAISTSELQITPQNDGIGLRIIIPKMTEDRRKDLVKLVGKHQEAAKVAVRNIRRDANDSLKKLGLPEDDQEGYLKDSQELTDKFIKRVDVITAEKEKELLTI